MKQGDWDFSDCLTFANMPLFKLYSLAIATLANKNPDLLIKKRDEAATVVARRCMIL